MPPPPQNQHHSQPHATPDLSTIGYPADPHLTTELRREVAHLLGRESLQFAGAQPISFARAHVRELKARDYYVCEKSDGIRCLLYFTEDPTKAPGDREIHYLIDRKNEYYYVPNLHFPLAPDNPKDEIDWSSYHTATLLDGELLYDTYPDGRRILKYLVFDCLRLDGVNLVQRTLDKRLAYYMDKIDRPYEALCKRFAEDAAAFRFRVEKKQFQLSYAIEHMSKAILPTLKHGSDGLIFTCKDTPYKFGTDEHILKWKPAEENTVDFRVSLAFPLRPPHPAPDMDVDIPSTTNTTEELDTSAWTHDYNAIPSATLCVHHGSNDYRRFAPLHLEPEDWAAMKQWALDNDDGLDGQVVECRRDQHGRWRFHRFRTDKTDGNHYTIVEKILRSIDDSVSMDELLGAAAEIRAAWKARSAAGGGLAK